MTQQDRSAPAVRPGQAWAAGLARPHHWPCRHCGMVTDYHLVRDAQLRAAESLDRRDEIDRVVTFKEWLRAYEWDTDPRHVNDLGTDAADVAGPWDDDWDTIWGKGREATVQITVVQQRIPVPHSDVVADARRAVAAIPDLDGARTGDELPQPDAAFDSDHVVDDGCGAREEASHELAIAGSYR